jgi:hypothetical protein
MQVVEVAILRNYILEDHFSVYYKICRKSNLRYQILIEEGKASL